MSASIWVPYLFTGRGLNDRISWRVRAKLVKQERGHVIWALTRWAMDGHVLPVGPYEVRLVRVYSGRERELDDDNWVGAAKSVRDQVAVELHVNDGDRSAIRFSYAQEKGECSGVRIEISTRATTTGSAA
jgi:hypothetical protein